MKEAFPSSRLTLVPASTEVARRIWISPSPTLESSMEMIPDTTLHRGLKSRHVQLLALGGCIGTGLFIGSGGALSVAGPASLFLSYCIMLVVIFFVMNMLGEMITFLPLPGNGAQSFVKDYVDDSLGFAISWNYRYAFSILVPTEITAAALLIDYWPNSVHTAVWITIFLVVMVGLNLTSVKVFGEAEFYFASIKIFAVVGLIVLGVVLFFGGGPSHDRLGFRYWKHGLAFKPYLVEGPTGRFLGFWYAVIRSGFAFICSPELVATAGSEAIKPRANIPKAASRFIYRLGFFYVLGTLVIGIICDSRSHQLLNGSSDASASPFVIGIKNAGIPVLDSIINAAILTSAASSGNSFLYSSSRVLYSNAVKGIAPSIFMRVNRFGVPYFAVVTTSLFGCLAYLNASSTSANVFTWLSNIATISGFLSWTALSVAYIRWRKAISHNDLWHRVTYKTILQPYGAYFVIFFVGLICLTNGFAVFFNFNGPDFVAAYVTFPILAALYVSHKVYEYFKLGRVRFVRPIEEIDVTTNLDLIEQEDAGIPARVPRNLVEKAWFWLA
ncbi:hypothetical protein CANTEDRAFT_99379 [Yamadazyma tenuis ATCC 10573]|uniref:Amino acid permease/ SLC12A domain-containing protein n=1 Tax=Candida tenuis (strain ATCC 10573 / BCRC 21748 / CBS 615 / JCM 9827 / NBRC 10315 / NRRL Y-1498 / VKM Y-70) TaxID=590646 RepID=G3B8D3_CANTC|nr:uncharacterized protein CANTEDRAFT_99379 [Yamadazyma tenuis ATCC 10573]EGV62371.1 hypothetical protein CANTEDRAFT_99379 [Yamadazyma tenuis ATCC 10573]